MNYGLSARAYAISANMLEDTEHEKWERLGLSEGDTMLASALVVTFLRITSIECGLRHLLQREGIKPGRGKGKHDLLAFWNRLPNECRQRIATACAAPESEVRTTLEHYRSGSVASALRRPHRQAERGDRRTRQRYGET